MLRSKKVLFIIISALFILWAPKLSANTCEDKIPLVVAQILWRDFGQDERYSAYLRGTNDVMCGEKENMANIAMVIFDKKSMEYFYAILHAHFDEDGKLIPTPGSIVNWKSTKDEDGWKNEWCDFIRVVYPHELKTQECT